MHRACMAAMVALLATASSAEPGSEYRGQESRDIKALSEDQVQEYLTGAGMGYAKAAELNRYPGPRHVLELADELALTADQTAQTQAVFEAMRLEAVRLGEQLVEKERELDQEFARGSIRTTALESLVSEIGELQARIRYVHLNAHLQQKALLTEHQVQRYVVLRGYGADDGGEHVHSH